MLKVLQKSASCNFKMAEMKVKEKFRKFYDKYVAVDEVVPEQKLSFAYEGGIDRIEEDKEFPSEVKIAFRALRQIFLFLPGTFLLNFLAGSLVYFWLVEAGLSWKPLTWNVLLIGLISSLLVILGIGDIRKSKHLVISGSIVLVGSIAGFLAYCFTEYGDFRTVEKIIFSFMPLALTAPFLAKFLVDRNSD